MRVKVIAIGWACFLAGCLVGALVPRSDKPDNRDETKIIDTEIGEVHANPARFAGDTLRLRGRLTQCFGWECSICPEGNTLSIDSKRCLPLSFRPLMPETGFGAKEKEQIFRFASVTLVARFDPGCLRPGRCTDRQVVLYDADVVAVHNRRASRDGLWIGDQTKLVLADAATSLPLYEVGVPATYSTEVPKAAFLVDGKPGTAVTCSWQAGVSAPIWPRSFEAALYAKTINDWYTCAKLAKVDGKWLPAV